MGNRRKFTLPSHGYIPASSYPLTSSWWRLRFFQANSFSAWFPHSFLLLSFFFWSGEKYNNLHELTTCDIFIKNIQFALRRLFWSHSSLEIKNLKKKGKRKKERKNRKLVYFHDISSTMWNNHKKMPAQHSRYFLLCESRLKCVSVPQWQKNV